MKNTKELIEMNNKKRELLTDKNKQIYEDFLLYFRTDLRVAEYECEEFLIDILDHILDAQRDGKTAKDVFGDDPEDYAKELISCLPSEKKRNLTVFGGFLILQTLGYIGMIYGLTFLILPFFFEGNQAFSVGKTIVVLALILLIIAIAVKGIFNLIRKPLFKENNKRLEKKSYVKAGLFGALSFILIFFLIKITPEFGPDITVEWWIYLLLGVLSWFVSKALKKYI